MTFSNSQIARLLDPDLRGLSITVLTALAIIFVIQLEAGSFATACVPVVCGIAGLLLRWTAMPVAVVLITGYFLLFPIGLPFGLASRAPLQESYFCLDDLLLVIAVLVYLSAQYRIFHRVLNEPRHRDYVNPWSRTSIMTVIFAVLAGQVAWWLLTNLELHSGIDAPLRWKPGVVELMRGQAAPPTFSAELSRFCLLVLGLAVLLSVVVFTLWYRRLFNLTSLEARMILLDTQWRFNRRELARLETWRSYRLGHDCSRRGNPEVIFRWAVRSIVLAILGSFLAFIMYVYYSYP